MSENNRPVFAVYLQEGIVFVGMFILTILHEWIFIDTISGFLKGFVFFLLLYGQAQLHRYLIFPFFLQKRFILYSILTILSTVVCGAIVYFVSVNWLQPECLEEDPFLIDVIYFFVMCIISTAMIMSISLMQSYSLEVQRRNKDQLMFNEMNLKFLHAQLNPHFFFNMLNNLYGVSLTEPKRTPTLILKLSALMRYQIENVNSSQVALQDELDFIRNYVDMERERTGKRCDIQLILPEENAKYAQLQIVPLLIIILVENSFKHSQNPTNWFVHIYIRLEQNKLIVETHNSLSEELQHQQSIGLGLSNIMQRLDALYKNRFTLNNHESVHSYRTKMTIEL